MRSLYPDGPKVAAGCHTHQRPQPFPNSPGRLAMLAAVRRVDDRACFGEAERSCRFGRSARGESCVLPSTWFPWPGGKITTPPGLIICQPDESLASL